MMSMRYARRRREPDAMQCMQTRADEAFPAVVEFAVVAFSISFVAIRLYYGLSFLDLQSII
jgi:hypothetical protein